MNVNETLARTDEAQIQASLGQRAGRHDRPSGAFDRRNVRVGCKTG